MSQSLLMTIQQKLRRLPESERKVAQAILDAPEAITNMNASQLGTVAGASAAAVIRFCRSIGVKSFTALKVQLASEVSQVDPVVLTDITPKENLTDIKKKLLGNTYYYFAQTNDLLMVDRVDQWVAWMKAAPTVFVHGLGASHLVAMDIKQKLTRIGKRVHCTQDTHELAALMAIAPEQSVYMGISNSGDKQEGRVLMQLAKKLQLRTISLTKDSDNLLRDLADLGIVTADTQDGPLRSGATLSLMTQMYTVDILFYQFMVESYEDNLESLQASHQATTTLEQLWDS